jgi:hypothetical protein
MLRVVMVSVVAPVWHMRAQNGEPMKLRSIAIYGKKSFVESGREL